MTTENALALLQSYIRPAEIYEVRTFLLDHADSSIRVEIHDAGHDAGDVRYSIDAQPLYAAHPDYDRPIATNGAATLEQAIYEFHDKLRSNWLWELSEH